MKKFLVILLSCTSIVAGAQTNVLPTTGSVGIGTTTPTTYLHVYRNQSAQYTPLLTLQDGLGSGYTQMAFQGSGRQYHIGVGNASEASFGLANKFYLWDQTTTTPRMVLNSNGDFGFGTTSPTNRVTIYGGAANTSGLQFARLNNTATAIASNGKVLSLDASGNVILVIDQTGAAGSSWGLAGNTGTASTSNFIGTTDAQDLVFKSGNLERMRISATGNISIGTNDAKNYKLAVNGDAMFTKIKVKSLSAWPDYVFEPSYGLRSLAELELFVLTHKHLPEVPSAAEVEADGVDVATTQAALLKKVEELTLYIIEQEKRLNAQEKEMQLLKSPPGR
jgi:hypothetical protein